VVDTEIFEAGGWSKDAYPMVQGMPALTSANVSQTVLFMLMTPYTVNITDIIVKPTGERF
jgi:NADP-dependent 3-hydroxy acid dehydrogenase YdfG